MNDSVWIRGIHDEIRSADSDGTRVLLRFRSKGHFRRCLGLIRKLTPSLPRLALLQPLHLIYSFSCVLSSPTSFEKYKSRVSLERDEKPAAVHGITDATARSPSGGSTNPWIPWGVKEIKAPSVWEKSTGASIKIGVIDTGIDYTHPDLRAVAGTGINLVQRNRPPVDDNGHGTHIAGTIAASSRTTGLLGVAPNATIHAVKAFDQNGTAFVSDIVYGIEWCVRNRMEIINMSFGMKTSSKALEDAVKAAYQAGTVVVASSGNEGRTSEIDFPARFPLTIAVGATNRHKKIASFSNRGTQVDIYAPGHKIVSTWLHGGYNELSGTSMATSHVSGVIALLLAAKPDLTPRMVRETLIRHSTSVTGKKRSLEVGEVNALQIAKSMFN